MKDILKEKVQKIVKSLYKTTDIDFSIDTPQNPDFGDLSANVAFSLAHNVKKAPQSIAEDIAAKLRKDKEFSKVETAGGGFVNVWLDQTFLTQGVEDILKEKKKYGTSSPVARGVEKVQLEFISANPTGPLTLGNGRGGFSGDTLAHVLTLAGHMVEREYYINDAGNQVKEVLAKSIKRELGFTIRVEEGQDLYGGDYIHGIAQQIEKEMGKEWVGEHYSEVGVMGAELIMKKYIQPDIKSLGISYDKWQSEQDFYDQKLIQKMWDFLKKKHLVYEKDGAEWLKTSEYGDSEDRVVMTQEGNFTYLMSDIVYLYDRFEKRKYDRVIVIVGADHHGYIDRWQAACEMLGHKGKLEVIVTQLVRLLRDGKEIRMSKRKGVFITLKEVVDEIGLAAARYFFISRDFNTHMDIDLDLAKEESKKNPVYYIQYASARIHSVLEKCKMQNAKCKIKDMDGNEAALAKELLLFPDVVEDITKSYMVHKLAQYTYELAEAFHRFYETSRIIGDKREGERIQLTKATQIVLNQCLGLMGIEVVEKM